MSVGMVKNGVYLPCTPSSNEDQYDSSYSNSMSIIATSASGEGIGLKKYPIYYKSLLKGLYLLRITAGVGNPSEGYWNDTYGNIYNYSYWESNSNIYSPPAGRGCGFRRLSWSATIWNGLVEVLQDYTDATFILAIGGYYITTNLKLNVSTNLDKIAR